MHSHGSLSVNAEYFSIDDVTMFSGGMKNPNKQLTFFSFIYSIIFRRALLKAKAIGKLQIEKHTKNLTTFKKKHPNQ